MKKKRKNKLLKEAIEYDFSREILEVEEEEDISLDEIIFIEEEEDELD